MKFYKIFFWSFIIFLTSAFSGYSQPCHLCDHLTKDLKEGSTAFREFMEQDFGAVGSKGMEAWEAMIPDELLRKDVSWLQKVHDYFNLKPNKVNEFKSHFIIEKGKGRAPAYLKSLTERQTHVGPVYRNQQSSLGYEDFFNNGMSPNGTHDNLLMHTESNTTAGNFISTSLDKDIARQFGSPNGWVFEIKSTNGIDINKTLGADAIHPGQFEVSIPDQVLAKDIKGVWQKQGGVLTTWIPNPNYIP